MITKHLALPSITNKKVLFITCLGESNEKYINAKHYSQIKGYILADGLNDMGYTSCFLTQDKGIYSNDNFFYINHNLLSKNLISSFTMIIFILHNKEVIQSIHKNTNLIENIFKAKEMNPDLLVINKTCEYPKIFKELGINDLKLFDKIILQTKYSYIPSNTVGNHKKISVEKYLDNCSKCNVIPKINFSEMTFNMHYMKESNDIAINKKTINIVYLGRLMGYGGLDMLYLMKTMKKLGNKYKLYILPGSFALPTIYPPIKHVATRKQNYIKLKAFIDKYELTANELLVKRFPNYNKKDYLPEDDDNQECNITVLEPKPYGEHFGFLKKMDIGLGFSPEKNKKHPEGSAKLFDYMCSKLLIVSQDGWGNSSYVEKYNFGKNISSNASVLDTVEAIKDVATNYKKNNINYRQYLKDHNYLTRVKQFLKIINN